MQVYTSKNILLLILLIILPSGLMAQYGKYITRSGDTTDIIFPGRTGLSGEDARFLFDEKASDDSTLKYSRYNKLKDAVNETHQVANIVEVVKKETNPSSGSLGFRISQQNIRYLQNEQKAQRMARDVVNRNASVEELLFLKEKFGNKPSYFINGIQVEPSVVALLSGKDEMTRSLKVSNTVTGNPNGEIWYVVNSKTFEKLGLENYSMSQVNYASNNETALPRPTSSANENSILEEEIITRPSSITPNEYEQLSPQQQQSLSSQQREVEELRRQIEDVKRQRAAISGDAYESTSSTRETQQSSQSTQSTASNAHQSQPARQHPNYYRQAEEIIISFRDSPQERTRRERDQMLDEGITDDTPKRSIRRIKDRERNR